MEKLKKQEKALFDLQYDGPIQLAVAGKRFSKAWKNKITKWSDILDKLSEPTRTHETVAEYHRMRKDDRDNLKDVGGYVAAMLKDGKRNKGSVAWRSMITLDADNASPDLWDRFCDLYDCAAAIYSTHSHREEAPKYRIIIPLKDALTAGECEAVAHFIVSELDPEQFDDTTYEPERLMYWPSCPKDGEYVFKHQDGPWYDAKALLERRPELLDASTWEFSSRHKAKRQGTGEKAGDPCAKPGILGAFCRTYDVPTAIEEFLSDIYVPCDNGDRYTYLAGSTSAGLVIYDDGQFACSNHGTDPAWGNHNAWDLVRIHKFGYLDEGLDTDSLDPDKLKSDKAMRAWALEIPEVKMELANAKVAEAAEDFSGLISPDKPNAWRAKLDLTERGRFEDTIRNARLVMTCDPDLRGLIQYNELARRNMLVKDAPWRKLENGKKAFWADVDEAGLREFMQARYKLQNRNSIDDAVRLVAHENHFHPIREYLDSLTWDGQERLETVLVDYMGAEDSLYTREATKTWFTAAVARVREPGCKFDCMLILTGSQGIGKSQFFSRIAKRPAWFSDSLSRLDNSKESMEQLAGKWIFEIGELAAMRKAEVESIKTFLSKQEDSYRPSYGRNPETFPRQCVFAGSSNRDDFLIDLTGNRRFWPIAVTDASRMWSELKSDVIDQIWAEANYYYSLYELGLMDLDLTGEARQQAAEMQLSNTEVSGKVGVAEEFLNRLLPTDWSSRSLKERKNWLGGYGFDDAFDDAKEGTTEGTAAREKISGIELYCECFNGEQGSFSPQDAREMGDLLRQLGWKKSKNAEQTGSQFGKQRMFYRP